jgi:hypothetical protein
MKPMDALTAVLVVLGVVAVLFLITRQRKQPSVESRPMNITVTAEYTPPKPTPDPGNPPDRSQLTKCERLGLTVKPGMTRRQVGEMLRQAMERPEIKARQDAYEAEQQAIAEAADREDYGDALVDERKEWQARCDLITATYMVAFKSGGKVVGDLMQFEKVEIEDAPKPFVRIDGLRPKVHRPRGESPYFEFEKEVTLKPAQILAVEQVPGEIDMFDLDGFERWLGKAQELAAEHRAKP